MRDMRIPACNAIKEFYSKIKACPFCGKRTALYIEMDIETGLYSVACDMEQTVNRGCGASGPQCKTIAGAVDAFNDLDVTKECEIFIEAQLDTQRELMVAHIQGIIDDGQSDGDTINAIRDYLSDVDLSGVI